MKKLILSATIASLVSSSAFAVLITTPADPILGVQLQGSVIAVAPQGEINGQNSTPGSGNENAQFSIDGSNGTKYLNFGKTNTGIIVDASDDLLILTGIELITGGDAPERDPATFSIYGTTVSQSVTFSDYTLIVADQAILGTDPGRGLTSGLITFTNPSNAPFDSYLVIFPTVRDSGAANSMQVSEIRLDGTVPEPTTFALLGLAAVGLAARRRRA